MKRILSCLLCLVFLSLAACRAQQEPPPESQTSSDTVHTESPEPKDFSLPFQVEDGAVVLELSLIHISYWRGPPAPPGANH